MLNDPSVATQRFCTYIHIHTLHPVFRTLGAEATGPAQVWHTDSIGHCQSPEVRLSHQSERPTSSHTGTLGQWLIYLRLVVVLVELDGDRFQAHIVYGLDGKGYIDLT